MPNPSEITRTEMTREQILALPPGRELDALVAEKVMGQKLPLGPSEEARSVGPWFHGEGAVCPSYSTDIAAAWQVVEKFQQTGLAVFSFWTGQYPGYTANLNCETADGKWRYFTADADTAPLAICRAALLAEVDRLREVVAAHEEYWRGPAS